MIEIFIRTRVSRKPYTRFPTVTASLVHWNGTNEILYVRGIDESKEEKVKKDLLTTLNDYKLRQIIEDETHEIRTILYAKAFADFEDIELEDV